MNRGIIYLAFVCITLLWGCPRTEDPVEDTGTPRIEVHPAILDFASTLVGESMTHQATIFNVGNNTLHIEELFIDGPASFSLDDATTDRRLAPGTSTTVSVTYTPTGYEYVDGHLTVACNDPTTPETTTFLTAVSIAPKIELDPSERDFGDVQAGCEQEVEITIRNVGNAPLYVQEMTFQPTSDEFVISYTFSSPLILESAGEEAVTVYYEPRDELVDTAYLHVYSNDPQLPDALATQYGSGHYGTQVVDEFVQDGSNQTDILWVVDNSCSMENNGDQINLLNNYSAFLDILDVLDIDYQIAAISTDSPYFLGPICGLASPNCNPFADYMIVDEANTTEQGLEMGIQALTSPLTDPGGENEGFLRDPAGLRVVYVSDEEDQSPDTVTNYVSMYQSLEVNPDHVVLSAIVDPAVGIRYDQAAAMTGGLVVDNNNPNWINALSQLAWLSSSWQDTFELSQPALEETIVVELNGVESTQGWYYDSVYQAVVFESDYIPETGDTITIRYNEVPACP